MKGGRRSFVEQTQVRLLDLWSGEDEFGSPLGCVTTSFTFDAALFEEQCLSRFLSIQSNPNETAKAYIVEREEKLSQCFTCVLVDQAHAAPNRSLRWNLLPVTLPRGGVLHAKVTLLVWENCIRVLIGSANLTEPGYRRNQELMTALDFGPLGDSPPELLTQCLTFLNRVRTFAPGADRKNSGPQAALAAFLKSVERQAGSFPRVQTGQAECALVSLVPGGATVVEQLKRLWKGPAPDKAWVLSPFYDQDRQASKTATSITSLLTTRSVRSLTFLAPGRNLPDGTVQIDVPEALKKSSHPSLKHLFSVVHERVKIETKEEDRALHAKAVWLERDGRALYMLGSSNFTAAGLGLHPRHNIELNVAYLIKDCASPFGKLCAQSWPQEMALDDVDGAQFLSHGVIDSAEASDAPLLPSAFGLAIFCLDTQGGRLELEIDSDAPETFKVHSENGDLLLSANDWLRAGRQRVSVIPWELKRPPSSLEVRWTEAKRGECTGRWVVNVDDMSALPPPDELAGLSLSELMEILTSARPLHEIVMRVIERREKKAALNPMDEIDPHKKVDTSQFLLQRMRRVAQALEGLRNRLQQPVGSVEALRWRLRGPIGPIALAKRLAEEDPSGAAFMIAEVATTIREVPWRPLGSLRMADINADIEQAIIALHELATKASAPTNLSRYVRASFDELLP